jgi:hypothetical protein
MKILRERLAGWQLFLLDFFRNFWSQRPFWTRLPDREKTTGRELGKPAKLCCSNRRRCARRRGLAVCTEFNVGVNLSISTSPALLIRRQQEPARCSKNIVLQVENDILRALSTDSAAATAKCSKNVVFQAGKHRFANTFDGFCGRNRRNAPKTSFSEGTNVVFRRNKRRFPKEQRRFASIFDGSCGRNRRDAPKTSFCNAKTTFCEHFRRIPRQEPARCSKNVARQGENDALGAFQPGAGSGRHQKRWPLEPNPGHPGPSPAASQLLQNNVFGASRRCSCGIRRKC